MKSFKSVADFFRVLAFASTLFSAPAAYAQTRHASEIERLAQTHTAGQVSIGKGDALSLIAKNYSRANNIPFDAALKGLTVANPNAFEDAQHNLIIGATFVFPLKQDVLTAAQTGSLPVARVPVEVVAPLAAPVAVTASAEPVSVPNLTAAKVEPVLPTVSIEPWAWPLFAVLSLMVLVGLSRRLRTRPIKKTDADVERHENGAPKVILREAVPSPIQREIASVSTIDEDDLPEPDDDAPLNTPMLDARFNRALAGLSADSLDLTLLDKPAEHIGVTSRMIVSPESGNNKPKTQFLSNHLRTPLQQLRELNAVAQAETTIHAKVEAMNAVQVPPEVLEIETAAAPTLNVDMPQFLHQFSHHLPEPTFTSVDYEDLLDKARLQAWLNIHTPEQILLLAQDAYDARYEDVAQLMLNDVLLRGNAEQVAAVLNLRYLWSYPQGVF